MIQRPSRLVDSRRAQEIVSDLISRRHGYLPNWHPTDKSLGIALTQIYARFLEAVLARLNQAPHKNKLAFLEHLGIEIIPAQAARAPLVFQLAEDAPAVHLPAGAQVAAPPPPEGSGQIVFETEQGVGLSPAKITRVLSLWPGRDQYVDHSEAFLAGESIVPFRREDLKDTPHSLYIAHEMLLALAGISRVDVEFELIQPGSEHLSLVWEYWDGKLWRGFKTQHPECAELGEQQLDSTAGLTRSGKVRLQTDCAETEKTMVTGVESFWIRAMLDEPLPPDPKQILPEVGGLKLTTVVERPLAIALKKLQKEYILGGHLNEGTGRITVTLFDNNDRPILIDATETNDNPLQSALIVLLDENQIAQTVSFSTKGGVSFNFLVSRVAGMIKPQVYELQISLFGVDFSRTITFAPESVGNRELEITATLVIGGLRADMAFADALELDLGGTFYPFGQQPQTGTAFYFSSEEVFSKPGAQVTLFLVRAETPQEQFTVSQNQSNEPQVIISGIASGGTDAIEPNSAPQDSTDGASNSGVGATPKLVLEYWGGYEWTVLQAINPSEYKVGEYTLIDFTVPDNMTLVEVNDQEGLWMRVRLMSGAFGKIHTVTWTDGEGDPNKFTYFIPQPPAVADFRISYVWEHGPFHPEQVLAYNDFVYTDRTYASIWPGESYQPFERLADLTPALYLGLDKPPPVDRTNLYFHVIEQLGADAPPAFLWEYWNGFNWRILTVTDETRDLRYPGILSFIGSRDATERERFGTRLHWLRGRLKEDLPPPEPELKVIHPNAAWASQKQTIRDENLGTSRGLAGEVFIFRHIPVLAGEHVEVRELSGTRASVEWRILAMELLGRDERLVQELDDLLGREGAGLDVVKGDLHLRRDRHKQVSEVWVRWYSRRHLLGSGPGDRHYVIDRARGLLIFGNGEQSKLLPVGAEIVAREYRSGGGRAGNVAAGDISQMLAGVAGIDSVSNPTPAEGGADAETLDRVATRGPRTVRHRGRGLLPQDLETMAIEASPAVAFAKAIPTMDNQGRERPGWVTLVVIPRSMENRPWPSFGLREQVRKYIEARTSADVAAAHRLYVHGPNYHSIDVEVSLAPRDPAQAGPVENAVRESLQNLLHPLFGGPEGDGWLPGRDVYFSDVAACVERTEGVDYVLDLAMFTDGRRMGEVLKVSATQIVVAGEIRIALRIEERL